MAEVPVSDVLCEATEYLCKLGFNLRSRSQNLKEKRINKNKLKNTHAVRKAATKLLLMCELSKKSLENVEIGVRKVLGIIESSRRSPCVGAINETSKTGGSKKEWFYIEYDSCKLRISKKILLEHYMSVKVQAKSMPVSMIENYPVYYKCALYKNRKKTLRESRFLDSSNESSRINLKKGESLENVPNKDATGFVAQGKENDKVLDLCHTKPEKCDKKKNEKSSENDSDLPKPAEQSDADAETDQNKASLHNKEIRKSESPEIHEPKRRKRDTAESAQSDCNSKNPEKNRDKNASQGSSNVQETDVSKEGADGSHSDISSKKPKKVEETQEPVKKIKLFDKCGGSKNEGKKTCVEPNSENFTKIDKNSTHHEMARERSCSVDKDNTNLRDKSKDSRHHITGDLKSEELKIKSSRGKKNICVEPNSETCTKSDSDSTITQNEMLSKKSHSADKDNEIRQSQSENYRDHLQSDSKSEELDTSSKSNNNSKNGTKSLNEMSQKKSHSVEKDTKILQHKSENSRDHLQRDLNPEVKTSSKSNNNMKNSGSESEGKKLCINVNSDNNTKSVNDSTHDRLSRKKSHSVDKGNEILQDKSEESRENLLSDLIPEKLKTCSKSNYNKIADKEETEGKVEDNNVNCRMSSKSPPSVMLLDSDSDSGAEPTNKEGRNSKKRILIGKKQRKENRSTEPEVVNLIDDDDSPRKQNQLPKANDEDSDSKTGTKPMIKLVSLNKLLKPGIVKSNLHEINVKSKNRKAKLQIAYIQEKKREVLAFKPKKFNVVITRLPTFSDDYLRKYGLRKIMKHGSTIYKLTNESLKDTETNIDLKKSMNSSKKAKRRENIETIEIDLTDEDTSMEKTIGKEIQENLVEKDDKPEIDSSTIETDKDKKSECDENNKQSVERPRTPESKNKKTDHTTPQSMRKAIMKSMEAKKMLLTQSSSSDSDDDHLKNALKAKHSLLNGSSSDEDVIIKPKLAKRRQLVTPSDSDDSLKITKRLLEHKKFKGLDTEASSISQIDGTNDELSSTGSSKMGRSKTKVSSSSKQTSESVDSNDEINRLTNLSSLTRSRRRHPRGSRDAHARSTRRMPKAPPIQIEGDPLPLESSDSVSGNDSNAGDVEDLPPITMQELNGDGINDLAKQDLLAQSDSSSSQNEKANGSEEEKKENSDDDDVEDNVKSRRRKPHTISSDSEAGSSRRKANKLSDFDESEEESQPRKKTKRKKKESDSDASVSSQDGSKKKRRRIKQVKDSDGSGSDTENEGKNKHGRKNIRKVMSKDQLEEATKKAARQEKERVARIAERQKTYNNVEFDETGKPDEVVLEKVVLDFDPETKEPLIQVDRGLVRKLKPHQANGIKFMWNACFESVKRIKKDRGSGCILAHCMGLGKTLQVVSLTHTLLVHSALTKVQRVLVVCPLSTVLNWVNEFNMWLKHSESDFEVNVFELSKNKQNSERAFQLQQWVECGGVCVLGYEMFRNLSADNNKKFKKKMLATFQQALVDPGPDLVVCDEGHLLKNEKTSLSQSMNRVRTLRRIVLTGTPLQNNLKEYYCMVTFVKPNLLGKYNEYLNRFVNPITNGQYTDSTERDISIMKRRSHVLHTMLDGAVQRRDYGVLAPFLPPKHEYVLFITLTEIQTKLYQHYLDNYSRRPLPGKSSGFLFPDFQSLQRIWTHPLVLKYNSERYEIMQQKKRDKEEEDSEGSLADFIDDDSTPDESSTEESSDDMSDASDDSRKKSKKKKAAKKGKAKDKPRRGTRANPVEQLEEDKGLSDVEEVKYENPTEWWMKLVTDEELEDMRHSHKLLLLFDILRQCDAIGDKLPCIQPKRLHVYLKYQERRGNWEVSAAQHSARTTSGADAAGRRAYWALLVFSQSLYSLDLIEHFLGKVDEATQDARIDDKLAGHVGSWSPGVDYFRLDGSTSCENRSIWCRNFNREDNPRARLFLISTRAGGLGINLVAANRVVIFDVSWNPSHDVQSIFRVYRFGQKKPCYIYRFLAMGTMEEKIYERQVTKQAISKRVIDEQQIDRHYAANDLAELYRFEPVPAEPRPTPPLPKDRLFAEMLKDREAAIFRFHEHDSLLENKEEETLSEEERKRAWEEFENEKRAPPPQAFQPPWAMTNGMASLLQQQQQQLAYAALAAMIRKDMPNINDAQIRDMLPIICNANPGMFGGYDYGLMQKMSDIYKYAQPGLMNPSMMNPAINPASGMSTSSSLQYEPPWQRQQQQQQQMRLQQLMQQQSMGAKYYAGGLGSRDPVAMALQQQRAREFLLAARAARAGRRQPRRLRLEWPGEVYSETDVYSERYRCYAAVRSRSRCKYPRRGPADIPPSGLSSPHIKNLNSHPLDVFIHRKCSLWTSPFLVPHRTSESLRRRLFS